MTGFDLTREPWLPVLDAGGPQVLSLHELFARAPELRGLALPFAPEHVVVTRILVAVLQAATHGPSDDDMAAGWLADPETVLEAVRGYLDHWVDRFDLFDTARPFMQQPIGDSERLTSIAALRMDWSSGNNATLFDHHVDAAAPAIDAPAAARALLTTLHHQPGGGVSRPFNRTDSPGTKAVAVLVEGRTLWETLVANAPTPRPAPNDPTGFGVAAWERPLAGEPAADGVVADLVPEREGSAPRGWLDRLTWRSRAVQLVPQSDGRVRHCRIHQHLKLSDGGVADPFHAVRYDDAGAPSLVRTPSGKRLWRSADAILHGISEIGDRPRSVAAQGIRRLERQGASRPQVLVAGLEVNQAKVGEAQSARLPISGALLADDARLAAVARLRDLADHGGRALQNACLAFQSAIGAERDYAVADEWQVPFWAALGRSFPHWLDQVAGAAPRLDEFERSWGAEVRRQAAAALDARQHGAAEGGRAWRAQAKSRSAFARELAQIPTTPREVNA